LGAHTRPNCAYSGVGVYARMGACMRECMRARVSECVHACALRLVWCKRVYSHVFRSDGAVALRGLTSDGMMYFLGGLTSCGMMLSSAAMNAMRMRVYGRISFSSTCASVARTSNVL
jgi:hypothetical protein